eukprot:1809053-Lingulodinium_polyedra.AAC.1
MGGPIRNWKQRQDEDDDSVNEDEMVDGQPFPGRALDDEELDAASDDGLAEPVARLANGPVPSTMPRPT